MKLRIQALAILWCLCLALIALVEFGLRLTGPGQVIIDRIVPGIGRTRAPNQSGTVTGNGAYGEFVHVTINALGLRGSEVPAEKAPGEVRVLCLGDSVVFGGALNDEDTFPAIAERFCGGKPERVRFLNAGGNGFDVRESAEFLDRRGALVKPDIVVLSWNWNDLVSVLYKTDYPLEPEWLRRLAFYKVLKFHSMDFPWKPMKPETLDTYGRTVMDCSMGPNAQQHWNGAAAAITRVKTRCHALGARLLVLALPEFTWKLRPQFPAIKKLTSLLDGNRILWVDAHGDFYEAFQRGEGLTQLYDPTHPNAAGQALLAKILCKTLFQLNWIPVD